MEIAVPQGANGLLRRPGHRNSISGLLGAHASSGEHSVSTSLGHPGPVALLELPGDFPNGRVPIIDIMSFQVLRIAPDESLPLSGLTVVGHCRNESGHSRSRLKSGQVYSDAPRLLVEVKPCDFARLVLSYVSVCAWIVWNADLEHSADGFPGPRLPLRAKTRLYGDLRAFCLFSSIFQCSMLGFARVGDAPMRTR